MTSAHQAGELISLAFTVPCILLCLTVVFMWRQSAIKGIRARRNITDWQWFALGVAVGFLGSAVDNFYWSIPWSLSFIGSASAPPWFSAGVWSNIPFRQFAGCFSAYCHIRCAIERAELQEQVSTLHWMILVASLTGVAYTVLLLACR